jgi:hypothetical protein
VAERSKGVDAFSQRLFEFGVGRELAAEPQQFKRRRARVVEHEQAIAESICPAGYVPACEAGGRVWAIGGGVRSTVHQTLVPRVFPEPETVCGTRSRAVVKKKCSI